MHIRFMTTNETVCEKPTRLGYDFVVVDNMSDGRASCDVCSQLLQAHNKREYEREGMLSIIHPHEHLDDDAESLAWGILVGVLIGLAFGIGVALTICFFWGN